MASREARLLVQLFANGQLARVPEDTRSPRWWRIVQLLEDEQQRQNIGHMADVEYIRNSILRLLPNLTLESKQSLDNLANRFLSLREQAAGIQTKPQDATNLSVDVNELRQRWVRLYGDPDDPVVQGRIAATVKFLMQPVFSARKYRKKND